ncbi:MAG: sulfotransferase [Muricomes sp.]
MRVITCASYYGTGSSAVTDLLTECKDIYSLGEYEYRFLQDPNGVSDLEFNVVENNHRHNTSDAIKTFLKYTKSLKSMGYGTYDIFGDQLEKLTEKYVEEITELKVHTWWNKDRIDKGKLFCLIDRAYSLFKRIITKNLHSEKKFSLLQHREYGYYTAISEDEFLEATRKYVDGLFSFANKENMPYIMVDQMVPPTNTERFTRYFNDVRIVVVDRDPRDLYILEKTIWQWGIIPVDSVEEFVEWFQITRKYGHKSDNDSEKVLRIQFEDMIYRYEDTVKKLLGFVGLPLTAHINPKTKFNPSISIRNTNLKSSVYGHERDISYIEEHLGEYLYDFESAK